MISLRFLCIFLFLIHNSLCKDVHLNNDDEQSFEYDENDNDIFITADEGFQILINVQKFNVVDTETLAHYMLIKAGRDMDDGYDGIIFSRFINTPRQYLSLKNEVYITLQEIVKPPETVKISERSLDGVADLFEEPEPEPNPVEFTITVRRMGEGTTTPEPTTTEIPWPTPSVNESDSVTVNITGSSSTWSETALNKLKNNIAAMALYYCDINNIEGEISTTNVLIDTIVQCPINWPNRKNCVQITFRLPIIRENVDDYQLNSEHLLLMWTQYSHLYLDKEFNNYNIPEASVFTLWLIIICVIILLFSVLLYVFKRCKQRLTGLNKRKKSVNGEDDNIAYSQAPRNDSLHPHPKQIVPGMFESESPYYDPH